jgi:hypothetical protein
MVWVWVPGTQPPDPHCLFPFVCLRGGGLSGAGSYVTPSLNYADCVITTSGSFLFFSGCRLFIPLSCPAGGIYSNATLPYPSSNFICWTTEPTYYAEDVVYVHTREVIHVAFPIHEQQCAFSREECWEQTHILATRCYWFKGRYKESKYAISIEQVLGSFVLCCGVVNKQREVPANLLNTWFQFRSVYMIFTVSARQVLVQSSFSSRARSKKVMNQTMSDVPGPLVVHVLLLTHGFMYNVICLPLLGISSVWQSKFFMCPKFTDDSPSLTHCGRLVLADAWLFTDFIQCCNVTNSIVPFFPFQGFFL